MVELSPAELIEAVRRQRGDGGASAPPDRYIPNTSIPADDDDEEVPRPDGKLARREYGTTEEHPPAPRHFLDMTSGAVHWLGYDITLLPSELLEITQVLGRAVLRQLEAEMEQVRATMQLVEPLRSVPTPSSPTAEAVPSLPRPGPAPEPSPPPDDPAGPL